MLRRLLAAFVLAVVGLPLAVLADTLIAPGDVLDVHVFGEPTLTQSVTVSRDGSVTLPMVGRLNVRGRSTNEAAAEIAAGLKRYLRDPIVAVAIKSEAQYNVLVLGNVKTPGRYLIQPGSHLTDALAAAGGMGPVSGKLPAARVSIGESVRTVSLDALLRGGDLSIDAPLADGAAVYVPSPVMIRVRVLGAVDHPGDVELNQGDRLAVAIAKAGNTPGANADLNRIRVTRTIAGATSTSEFNLYKALHDGDLASDMVLAPDDVIYVPEAKKKNADGFGVLFGLLRRLVVPF
ncbi:MAG: polysaccharide biosynthesis/export protein [Candidatus Eremiobacteraeota bacterium]|jgi:polysaccharide export outer membrane protein|nr:polysaccharide biosynthesis/export protein [Candidatus Eremiobacteraeota bacterium]